MSKFKSGNKVKIVRFRNKFDHNIEFVSPTKVGDVITLQSKFEENGRNFWYFEGGRQYIREDDLEAVEEAPEYSCIRVVPPSKPKREIVKGIHCLPSNSNAEYRIDNIDNFHTGLCANVVLDAGYLTPNELREFSTILNEIASVLEENAQ